MERSLCSGKHCAGQMVRVNDGMMIASSGASAISMQEWGYSDGCQQQEERSQWQVITKMQFLCGSGHGVSVPKYARDKGGVPKILGVKVREVWHPDARQ